MIRTFLDAGVLIAAIRGQPDQALLALRILEDPEREFVASAFLRLEVLPKALHQRREFEIAFYERFFERVVAWAEPLDELVHVAEQEAAQYGLNALDGLHVAARTDARRRRVGDHRETVQSLSIAHPA